MSDYPRAGGHTYTIDRSHLITFIWAVVAPRQTVQIQVHASIRLPIGHSRFVERHEVDLTRGRSFGTAKEHLVVALAQELQPLRLLVHEHAVQVATLHRADLKGRKDFDYFSISKAQSDRQKSFQLLLTIDTYLDGLIAPSHDLACADVRH